MKLQRLRASGVQDRGRHRSNLAIEPPHGSLRARESPVRTPRPPTPLPRVSVVVTAYNAAAFIGETLDSILAQTFKDLEVIVVDGGSTDQTVDVVSRYPDPVRAISGERLTKSAGRNVGIRAAAGEFIALVDADDVWLPQKLTRQMEVFERLPACQWVYSDCFLYDDRWPGVVSTWSMRNRLYSEDILEPLLFDCFVPSPTPVIRRKVFDRVGLYDESFLRHEPEDWDLWLRIAAQFPVVLVNEPLAKLRIHSESLTSREDLRLTAEGALSVIGRAFERNPRLPEDLRKRVLSRWCVSFGRGLVRRGRAQEGRAFFAKAIGQRPFDVRSYLLWMIAWLAGGAPRALSAANLAVTARRARIKAALQKAGGPRE